MLTKTHHHGTAWLPVLTNDLKVDPEFEALIPPLSPGEFAQLEENILRDGCLHPLCVWDNSLVDGHNRHEICTAHSLPFDITPVSFESRDHAKAWICEQQLGRRNLTDDQRAIVADDVREVLARIARAQQLEVARAIKSGSVEAKSTPTDKPKERTRTSVAKQHHLPEKKLRHAQDLKKKAPEVRDLVRDGKLTLVEAKRFASLDPTTRGFALKAFNDGKDWRTAIREAKKRDYLAKIAANKPKPLDGSYRIFYADPPWKYDGLNQVDEYGHAERHYEPLDDAQLMAYRPGGGARTVRELADDNSVLFIWVTSPMLERCFPIIRAWGFEYKASFVWDKIKHVMGHYNSVRHELLLVGTRGACTPDVPKLFDSVRSIERSDKHSEKPEEFYEIISSMYTFGRKLELFCRNPHPDWDVDGNEV
jgi:N6-adenosine-specific RNA methylase IME4